MEERTEKDYEKIGNPVLLEKIDKLFECNVGDLVDLPIIVVVGDQSSGKSCVLAGLTKLPFPRDSGLCTRFATQIIFRRSNIKKIGVSIIPAPASTKEHAEKVKAWHIEVENLDNESFTKILSQAHEVMNLSSQTEKEKSSLSTFSEDVLRLEIQGPDDDHLSVIDVPGLFTNTTDGVTSKEDITIVQNMVLRYMRNPRSVMLAVVPANVDIATQAIIQHAKELDPSGERTLGVFTKPDLVDEGAEVAVLDMLNGEKSGIKLGWNVVRNPGQKDLSMGKIGRDSEEAFFNEVSPWKSVDKDKVGIESLRGRLQEVLTNHIRREFPKVKAEISKQLAICKKELQSFGADRSTPQQQAAFLLDIVTKFQDIVGQALVTDYGRNDVFEQYREFRLATLLVHREEEFGKTMIRWGQQYHFEEGNKESETDSNEELVSFEFKDVRETENPIELEDILQDQETVCEPQRKILEWLQGLYHQSKGFEIGTFSGSLLATVMRKQASKWRAISLGYISDVIVIVHEFITKVLDSVCPDKQVHSGLLEHMTDELTEIYKKTIHHVHFLLSAEFSGILRTQNQAFGEKLDQLRAKDHPMSNAKNAAKDIHAIIESYYNIALNRFVDSVTIQAVYQYLVVGPNTPLKLLSPAYIQQLTPESLQNIAGEASNIKRKRQQLEKRIGDLEAARRILR
ncbi:hypothetical protein LOZ57_001458 [Ophidiomyces ophidiicola]|uniref:uncharacterized protein n=1 Tax=Ophidiomyces ophidiicola TaxID=1387563 RepID=UPI0020C5476C|nr:uncharacterized protein LOZ57_001458 [Ophidiomyces ophidiicola]KAI1950910.1 hypothetical protein LOZ57_001458 [Ophidiomyces ophidiicola]KAI2057735.1 hypothetical protein LOZ43_002929 [Ophidiomyces ophidiicola]